MSEIQRRYATVRIRKKGDAVSNSDFLSHYGISGQKWGVRRFQNEDRTLTEEGKKRYSRYDKALRDEVKEKRVSERQSKKEARQAKKEARQARKEAKEAAIPESMRWRPEEAKYLDDAELNRRNNRLQREKQYMDMTTPQWKKNMKRGAIGVITAATTVPIAGIASEAVRKIYRGEFNKFVAPFLGKAAGVPAEVKVK